MVWMLKRYFVVIGCFQEGFDTRKYSSYIISACYITGSGKFWLQNNKWDHTSIRKLSYNTHNSSKENCCISKHSNKVPVKRIEPNRHYFLSRRFINSDRHKPSSPPPYDGDLTRDVSTIRIVTSLELLLGLDRLGLSRLKFVLDRAQ